MKIRIPRKITELFHTAVHRASKSPLKKGHGLEYSDFVFGYYVQKAEKIEQTVNEILKKLKSIEDLIIFDEDYKKFLKKK